MPIIDINGKKVHVSDDDHSAHVAAEYLKKNQDNAKAFFEMAHHDHANGVAHFEIPHSGAHPDISHHFSIVHQGDGTYSLQRRHGY